jgi:hypothetical protein
MFRLFRRREPTVKCIDKVWLTEKDRFNALLDAARKDNQLVIICWFDDTFRRIEAHFSGGGMTPVSLLTAREARGRPLAGRKIVFAEHYPVYSKEEALFREMGLTEATVYSSLDEPLFTRFGGEKIAMLAKSLGMDGSAALEHPMISRSILRAQEKISGKISFEQSAASQKDWFEKNFPS